jgi:MFS superfamily sulfate permease-like transporter
MIRVVPALIVVPILLWIALTGCEQAPQQAAPPVIINNTGDGGTTVLLTVVIGLAFLGVIAAVVFGMLWGNERTKRIRVEDSLVTLTGLPVAQARLAIDRQQPQPLRAWTQVDVQRDRQALDD